MPTGEHWHSSKTDTAGRLIKVVDRVNKLNPDVVIITGDAVDTGSKEAYDHFKMIIANLNAPIYIIPGNHDDREQMRIAFSNYSYMPAAGPLQYVIDNILVRLIGLDTNVVMKDYGELTESTIDWLAETLSADLDKPTIIFMHHFPFPVGQPIFDTIICNSSSRFEELVRLAPNIIGIMAGHYHQQLSSTFGGKPFFIGKSVAPSHEFSSDGLEVIGLKLEDPAVSIHTYNDVTGILLSRTEIVSDKIILQEGYPEA
jgi:3',5'-cyclic AMP phosphodiesterase CpdA